MKSKKAKIKAKAAKTKAKMKGKRVKIAGACVLLALLCVGCSSPASRANTQNYDDCVFRVTVYAVPAGADGTAGAAGFGDILTQNMVVENSGTESTAQPYAVSPNVPVSVPVGAGGGESLSGLIGSILGGGKTASAAASGAGCETCAEK